MPTPSPSVFGTAGPAVCLLLAGWGAVLAADPPPDACSRAEAVLTLRLVNEARAAGASCGARGHFGAALPLVWQADLERMARDQAAWLAARGRLAHTGPDGQSLAGRAAAAGYRYAHVTENLAQGQADPPAALRGWAASEAHCVNLFDPGVTEMALACAMGGGGRPTWVLVMGRPP